MIALICADEVPTCRYSSIRTPAILMYLNPLLLPIHLPILVLLILLVVELVGVVVGERGSGEVDLNGEHLGLFQHCVAVVVVLGHGGDQTLKLEHDVLDWNMGKRTTDE